jgi:hypothetical protein
LFGYRKGGVSFCLVITKGVCPFVWLSQRGCVLLFGYHKGGVSFCLVITKGVCPFVLFAHKGGVSFCFVCTNESNTCGSSHCQGRLRRFLQPSQPSQPSLDRRLASDRAGAATTAEATADDKPPITIAVQDVATALPNVSFHVEVTNIGDRAGDRISLESIRCRSVVYPARHTTAVHACTHMRSA